MRRDLGALRPNYEVNAVHLGQRKVRQLGRLPRRNHIRTHRNMPPRDLHRSNCNSVANRYSHSTSYSTAKQDIHKVEESLDNLTPPKSTATTSRQSLCETLSTCTTKSCRKSKSIKTMKQAFEAASKHRDYQMSKAKLIYDRKAQPDAFGKDDLFLALHPAIISGQTRGLAKNAHGPFRVLDRVGPVDYLIQLASNSNS